MAQHGALGGVQGLWVRAPTSEADRLLLHFHGGAFVAGAPEIYTGLLGELARLSRRTVFSVDYRLAPENPFPVGLADSLAAFRGAAGATEIALLGDSAGGALALSVAQHARDEGLPPPSRVALFSPWIDLTLSAQSHVSNRDDDWMVDGRYLERMAGHYLGGRPASDPQASPLYGGLANLPPLLVQVGSCEILLDDALELDRQCRAAGTSVELQVWADMFHGWQLFLTVIPQSRDAVFNAGRWLAN